MFTGVDVLVLLLVAAGFAFWKVGKTAFDANPELKGKAEQKAVDAVSRAIDKYMK